jgi:hypothetical protein
MVCVRMDRAFSPDSYADSYPGRCTSIVRLALMGRRRGWRTTEHHRPVQIRFFSHCPNALTLFLHHGYRGWTGSSGAAPTALSCGFDLTQPFRAGLKFGRGPPGLWNVENVVHTMGALL